MFYVVAYDIPDDRRRLRLLKALKGFGVHTQYSVFECCLDDRERERMESIIRKIVTPSEDAVKLYLLCRNCTNAATVIGVGTIAVEPDVIVV